jgi:hypothetical protein
LGPNPMHLDANESAFFQRELEYIKSRTYDARYKQLKGLSLIPISTEANTGATEITFRRYKGVGLAKIISDYANDFPRVDVYGSEETAKVKGIGDSYGYNIKEIRSSQMTGKRLDQRRAEVARRANDEKVNSIALKGNSKNNLQGIINYPGITEYTVPADGTGSSKLWSTKTSDQIVRDVSMMLSDVTESTYGIEIVDTLLLPLQKYNYIKTTRMGSNNDTTILEFILKTNPDLKTVDWLTELTGAGANGTDRMVAYPRDENHLTLEIPQAFEQFEPQQKGMAFEIPCHSETAGVIVYYPTSVVYGDGI